MKAECGFRYWRDLWKILSARDGAVRHHKAKVPARDVPGSEKTKGDDSSSTGWLSFLAEGSCGPCELQEENGEGFGGGRSQIPSGSAGPKLRCVPAPGCAALPFISSPSPFPTKPGPNKAIFQARQPLGQKNAAVFRLFVCP